MITTLIDCAPLQGLDKILARSWKGQSFDIAEEQQPARKHQQSTSAMLYELIGVVCCRVLASTYYILTYFQVRPGRGVNEIKEYALSCIYNTTTFTSAHP